jgi:hypothetical protein
MNYIIHDNKHNIDIYKKKARKYHGIYTCNEKMKEFNTFVYYGQMFFTRGPPYNTQVLNFYYKAIWFPKTIKIAKS